MREDDANDMVDDGWNVEEANRYRHNVAITYRRSIDLGQPNNVT